MSNQSFSLVIPELDNAAIRRTSDGRASVIDLIMVIGGHKSPREVWKRLMERNPEAVTKCDGFKFLGRGQQKTPVTDRKGWAYIIGLLPGVVGNKYREEAANLVLRYLDADVTLAEEIVERTNDEQGLDRLEARLKGKKVRNEHTQLLMNQGVRPGIEFGVCTNKTYSGLYGTDAKGLRKQKGLAEKANVRNHLDINELMEVSFAENLSTRKIKQENAFGVKECGDVNYRTAKSVAELIQSTLNN